MVVSLFAGPGVAEPPSLLLRLLHGGNSRDGMRVVVVSAVSLRVAGRFGKRPCVAKRHLHAQTQLPHMRVEVSPATVILPTVVADERAGVAIMRAFIPGAEADRGVTSRIVIAVVKPTTLADK